jgi:uncharacterized protein (TIGR02001 family)
MRILAALGLLATAAAANAEVTGTAAIVSDYDFRGITQTNEDAALQLSIDYGHESGWYAGVWGSNVDFGSTDPSHEIDVYTGFKGSAGDFGWDAGIVYYTYPSESDFNYPEIYGKFSFSILSGGLYYSNDFGASDDGALYVYADVGVPAGPVTFTAHAGYSTGDGIQSYYFGPGGDDAYSDFAIGVSYSASNLTLGLKWVTTDGFEGGDAYYGDRVILSVSTALPWGE